MDNIKGTIIGTIVTIIIGGAAYNVNQGDIVKNFADDAGLTKEQAEQYIKEIPEENLATWSEIGSEFVNEGQGLLKISNEIDCINYEYEWESFALPCSEGKAQLAKLSRGWILLGQSYIKLSLDSATENDIKETIRLIDQVNSDLELEFISIIVDVVDQSTIDETKTTNLYNKALLKTVLDTYHKND